MLFLGTLVTEKIRSFGDSRKRCNQFPVRIDILAFLSKHRSYFDPHFTKKEFELKREILFSLDGQCCKFNVIT